MSILAPATIEDHIFSILQKGSLSIVELIKSIQNKRPKTTKQGVYLTIRNLKKQEIVVVHKKNISLSSVWLTTMEKFFAQAQFNTRNIVSPGNAFLNLKPGEKLQYYFKNPILTDSFWSHVFLTLVEVSVPRIPVLIYNPHEWFLLVRNKNEVDLFDRISGRGQRLAVLVGHKTPLDLLADKYLTDTKEYETLATPMFSKNNYYLNVVGDFVIEAWLDKKSMDQVDDFYQTTTTWGESEREKLEKILSQKGKNKFSISYNKRKADGIRRKFKKYFFL